MKTKSIFLLGVFILCNWHLEHVSTTATHPEIQRSSSNIQTARLPSGQKMELVNSLSISAMDNISTSFRSKVSSNEILGIKTSMLDKNRQVSKISRNIRAGTRLSNQDDSLEHLLVTIVRAYLRECNLIILINGRFQGSGVLQGLVSLPNFKQVISLDSPSGYPMNQVPWKSKMCQGMLFLISDPEPFLSFGNENQFAWDYKSRVIIVGLTKHSLEKFLQTPKATKTEQIIAIIQTDTAGIYKIFMNQLFWDGRGLVQISVWRKNSFTVIANLFPDKISNLHQAVLKLLVFEWAPAIIYRRDSDGNLLERYGRDVEVFKALQKAFNFTVHNMEPDPSELFGVLLPNGSYSGMVGLLNKGIGDIAIANHWIMMERAPFLDYSAPFSIDQGCCMARVEPPLPLWQSPGLPFQLVTWLAIFVGMILAGPILHVLARSRGFGEAEEPSLHSLNLSSLYTFGVHFSQPMNVLPESTRTRLFTAFLWVYSIILSTGYKSNLTAFLTVSRQPDSVETFKELYDSGIQLTGHPYFKNEFVISEIEHLKALVHRYHGKQRFGDTKEDVLAGRAVTLNSRIYLEFFVWQTKTPSGMPVFRIMRECTAQHSVAIAYQRNSPLKAKFDLAITHIFESGLPRRWFIESMNRFEQLQKETEEKSEEAEINIDNGVVPLRVDHVQGVFILWVFGCILSATLFFIEVIYAQRF